MRVIVVGSSAAAMVGALDLAEGGAEVKLVAPIPLEQALQSASLLEVEGETDPLIALLDRLGVPLDRSREGRVRVHAVDGKRVIAAGTILGMALHRALERQVRFGHLAQRISVEENRVLLGIRGSAVATLQVWNGRVHADAADAVLVADHGAEGLLGRHTSGPGQGHLTLGALGFPVENVAPRWHALSVEGSDRPRVIPEAALLHGAVLDGELLRIPRGSLPEIVAREARISGRAPPYRVHRSIHGVSFGARSNDPRVVVCGPSAPTPESLPLRQELLSARSAARDMLRLKAAAPVDTGPLAKEWQGTCDAWAAQDGTGNARVLAEELGTLVRDFLVEKRAIKEPLAELKARIPSVHSEGRAATIHALHASVALAELLA